MEYTVEYLPDKKIVSVRISERLNFQIAENYSKDAIKLARRNECNKFIIDHSGSQVRGIQNIHADGDQLQQFGFTSSDRIAIVIAHLEDESGLPDPATKNSRWSVLKYFYSNQIDDALEWLAQTE